MDSFARLVAIMARLRAPGGCPWDREQTHQSLREYLLEEAFETIEALDEEDSRKLCEELGDLLLQIVFHAQIAGERGVFDIDAVCNGIADKLVRRHPHVFGDLTGVEEAAHVPAVWEARKRAEAGDERQSALDGVPISLPALARAHKLQRRAAQVGFDWPDTASRLDKVHEELAELAAAAEAGDRDDLEAEYGDLLFMVVNVGRGLGLDAEQALRRCNRKFERRFRTAEAQAGGSEAFAALSLAEQDGLWEAAKAAEEREPAEG